MRLVGKFANPHQLKLHIGRKSTLLVTSVVGSFESVHHDDHLSIRQHIIKDSFSILSMIGLGFSMTVLGFLIGFLVGYVLWKRNIAIPFYSIGWDQAPLLRGQITDIQVDQSCHQNELQSSLSLERSYWRTSNDVRY